MDQEGFAGLELNFVFLQVAEDCTPASQTASPLSTSPAWSEFPELIIIQEQKEAQEYQAHAQRTNGPITSTW